jgi:hypothetical protein
MAASKSFSFRRADRSRLHPLAAIRANKATTIAPREGINTPTFISAFSFGPQLCASQLPPASRYERIAASGQDFAATELKSPFD